MENGKYGKTQKYYFSNRIRYIEGSLANNLLHNHLLEKN